MFVEKGYITTDDFKDMLTELDPELSDKELDGIVNEIDQDGSGTVDFEGLHSFCLFKLL